MATFAQWVEGARPRTLPAGAAPVVAGTGVAALIEVNWGRALLALLVSLALQVGVNYANDYSDGVRGTDADRVGPMRLVGGGHAPADAVKWAAWASFAVAAGAGLVLVAWVGAWWLLLVGVASIVAAWFYTGGPSPYGYAGLGEVFVFVFFGLVAVSGTTYTQTLQVSPIAWVVAIGIGAIACAILVANNLRDIPGDTVANKRTLAVRLGDRRTRVFFVVLHLVALLMVVALGVLLWLQGRTPWVFLVLLSAFQIIPGLRLVCRGARGAQLIPVIASTGAFKMVYATGIFCALYWA